MAALWTGAALAGALDAVTPAGQPPVTGLSIDTRTLQPGDLFVALKDQRDGHDFVRDAFAAGAGAALVDAAHAPALAGAGPLYVVDQVLPALERLGRVARARTAASIVAVTGSVGKTSTKEMLRAVLGAQGPTHASVASYNNHWGVPLTLARMPSASRFGVFEIGMNHSFEILPLTAMVRPHAAIVTTVVPVHLAQFPGIEAIADAKGEIFSGLEPGGVAILNRDNPHFARLKAHAGASPAGRVVSFGSDAAADVRLGAFVPDADGSEIEAHVFGRMIRFRLGAPGRHMAENALAVLAAVDVLGADVDAAAAAMAAIRPADGRGRRMRLVMPEGTLTLFDEAYNANPTSVRAALEVLGAVPVSGSGRRIAVLGDMLELGPDGAALHAGLAPTVLEAQIDRVFAAGPLMKNLIDALPSDRQGGYATDSAGLESRVLEALRPGDVVTVKGSNGSRMARIVAALKARYPALVEARAEEGQGS